MSLTAYDLNADSGRYVDALVNYVRWQGRRSYVFSGSGPTHFFRSWVQIGIGPTHFLRWIVYYCVCIQHDIDKSQISFTELCKTLRTNSGLRAINSCLHLFWPQLLLLLTRLVSVNIVLWQQKLKFSFHQQTVEFGLTRIFTQIYAHVRCYGGGVLAAACKAGRYCQLSWPTTVQFVTLWASTFLELSW